MSKTTLTKQEFEVIIKNYKDQGRDTTDLEQVLNDTFPSTRKNEGSKDMFLSQKVAELREASPVTQGQCPLCNREGRLISGVCETCFEPWATKVASDALTRATRIK